MSETLQRIKKIEDQIEKALHEFEMHEELTRALANYQEAEAQLRALGVNVNDPAYPEEQRVLSYCLMRQGNILRQLGRSQDARSVGLKEIEAARISKDEITLARSLMSNGTNLIVTGDIERGLQLIEEARTLSERGEDYDSRQMLGWYWILQADLANAGLVKRAPAEIIDIATRALDILMPIENWPGVARAYAAQVKAHEMLGDEEQAAKARKEQALYESKPDSLSKPD